MPNKKPKRAVPAKAATTMCTVCRERPSRGASLCSVCGADYDRRAFADVSIWGAIGWAAERARRFEAKRGRKALRLAAKKGTKR